MTVYSINKGIGWASSGVEYAQAYRGQVFRKLLSVDKKSGRKHNLDKQQTANSKQQTANIKEQNASV
ncbi:hypothetical protein BTI62_04170 [Lactobacillus delbrueckii subsp. bulgaricus]|nr:hypothetical protein [Lactobacillus delbrueckii subsp. bulgaricus]MBT8922889.1 hypothetical protein [Lactobacillus delbrueckii subsp. bulgaricus]